MQVLFNKMIPKVWSPTIVIYMEKTVIGMERYVRKTIVTISLFVLSVFIGVVIRKTSKFSYHLQQLWNNRYGHYYNVIRSITYLTIVMILMVDDGY